MQAPAEQDACYLPTTGRANYLLAAWTAVTGGPKVKCGMSVEKIAALAFIRDLVGAGRLRIVIDRCYPPEQIAEAHRYVDQGHKQGNVVVTL